MTATRTLGEIATAVGGVVRRGDPGRVVRGLATLDDAGPDDLAFVARPDYAPRAGATRAGALLVSTGLAVEPPADCAIVEAADAERAIVALLGLMAPPPTRPAPGVHPSAAIEAGARVAPDACIGPLVHVGADATIGAGAVLHAGARVYAEAVVGDGCVLHAGATVRERVRLGRGVVLHANAVVGGEGFGFRPAPDGRGLARVPHLGTVVLDDGVEVGANTCIDRAKFGATVVGAGTKIDNLCQIAHNCRIGRNVIIAGCVGLAGSVEIGDGAILGGGVGVADHIRIGKGARVGAFAGVMDHIPDGETWLGTPAMPRRDALRLFAAQRTLVHSRRRSGREG